MPEALKPTFWEFQGLKSVYLIFNLLNNLDAPDRIPTQSQSGEPDMRSILEQAIVHLLNEEQDKAEALFHKFMVERARQIHESLRQGEDPILDESWDEITEADLDDLAETEEEEAEEVEAVADETAEAADEVEAELTDAEEASEEAGEDAPIEVAVEARLEDLEAQLEKLTAEFEAMMADEDEATSDEMDAAEEDAEMADAVADDMEIKVTEAEDEAVDEDEFEDITESVLDDLETINVGNVDGVGADGSKLAGNHESPVAKKAVAKGVEVDTEHKHDDFDLEAAPASKEVKGARNAKKSVADAIAPVPAGGDKKAKLNKPNYTGE